jgi:hypothetical protein
MKRVLMTIAVVTALLATAPGFADVVIDMSMHMEMMGMTMDMTGVSKIKGEMSYTSMKPKDEAGMPGGAAVGGTNIMRLDKGVMWMLVPATKQYQEYKLADMKAEAGAAAKEAEAAGADEPDMWGKDYDWTVELTDLGESEIAGFACQGVKAIATGVSKKTPTEKSRITQEIWIGKDLPGTDELLAHFDKLVALTGNESFLQGGMSSNNFLKDMPAQMEKLYTWWKGHKGYPVKMNIIVETSQGMPDMGEMETPDSTMDPETAAMMQQMKSMMGKKSADGMSQVMSVGTMVTGVSQTPISTDIFEIPAGYTKQQM